LNAVESVNSQEGINVTAVLEVPERQKTIEIRHSWLEDHSRMADIELQKDGIKPVAAAFMY